MLDLSKSMVTCSIDGDAYEIRWWYIALLVGYKPTAEHYRGSVYDGHESMENGRKSSVDRRTVRRSTDGECTVSFHLFYFTSMYTLL